MEALSERKLEDMRVEELKKICRARGLAVSGTKAQLLNRLQVRHTRTRSAHCTLACPSCHKAVVL